MLTCKTFLSPSSPVITSISVKCNFADCSFFICSLALSASRCSCSFSDTTEVFWASFEKRQIEGLNGEIYLSYEE